MLVLRRQGGPFQPDRILQFPLSDSFSKEPAEILDARWVAFAGITAQELIFPRVADSDLLDVGVRETSFPAGETPGFKSKSLLDEGYSWTHLRLRSRTLLVPLVGAVGAHYTERAGMCMQIETKQAEGYEDAGDR